VISNSDNFKKKWVLKLISRLGNELSFKKFKVKISYKKRKAENGFPFSALSYA